MNRYAGKNYACVTVLSVIYGPLTTRSKSGDENVFLGRKIAELGRVSEESRKGARRRSRQGSTISLQLDRREGKKKG